jgi:hypothetical protein
MTSYPVWYSRTDRQVLLGLEASQVSGGWAVGGGGLNCNVPWSFAVIMNLKTALQPVKAPLFGTNTGRNRLYLLRGKFILSSKT